MKKLLCSYLVRGVFIYFALIAIGYCISRAEPPAWLQPKIVESPAPSGGVAPATPAGHAKIKTIAREKKDTVIVVKTDTIYIAPLKLLKYKYKLSVCNLDYNRVVSTKVNLISFDFYKDILDNLNNEEKAKNCYFSSTYSDTNYVYSYGVETVRANGYIYDNYGNKLEQTEKILTGITLNVRSEKVVFDYLENKKLSLQNSFNENQVNFYADYTLFERRCNFWIFCNFLEKKQYIFLNLTREEI
jgi:hypothetical protein